VEPEPSRTSDDAPDPRPPADGGEQLPVRIERERLPDGRSITYYSRPDAAAGPSS
jgi:hypothetical protein